MTPVHKDDIVETMRRHRICVLVPTYNNAGTLRQVLSGILEYASDVIVVNDGSTDSTQQILQEMGSRISVVGYEQNRGKGYALKTGFRKALELGYDYAVTIDSDGQHYPEDLPLFIEAIVGNFGSLVVGERDLSNVDINSKSLFANKFSNFWFSVQTGKRLNDTQTGYRAYPLKNLHGLSLLTSRYEAELELLVFASWNGVEISSIPIRVYYPPRAERVSHFRPLLDFTRISILNVILCMGALLYGLPVRLWKAIWQRRLFNREFRPFTRKHGTKREAAVTLGRLGRSLYGFMHFAFWSIFVFVPFTLAYFSVGKKTEAKKLTYHKILQRLSSFLARNFPGAKTTFENPGAETFDTPALVVCNHQSHLDLPVMMSVNPKLIFLTNAREWNNFFYSRIIRNAEFLPVSDGVEAIMPQLRSLVQRGYSIVVFPEGTRSADCSILRFHQGAFLLARELDLDIVPMVLHGVGYYLPKEDFMFRKGKITLKILPRVSRDTFAGLTLLEQASRFRKLIREEHNNLALQNETADYFKSLVLYKYAYRGWNTVCRSKRTLKSLAEYAELINSGRNYRRVRIINSGIGTFALLYALVNKNTDVFACEENVNDHNIAASTAALPRNLHHINTVWSSQYGDKEDFDITIVLGSAAPKEDADFGRTIHIPLQS